MRNLWSGVFGLLLSSCSMSDPAYVAIPADNIINVGDTLPAFTITMNDGHQLSTSQLKGKPSLIVFFSTTCPDCQRELPRLNERYLAHGTDTTFVAIAREQTATTVCDYWQQNDFSLPYSAQPDRTVYSLFALRGIPRIYISNAQCIVQQVMQP